MGEKRVDAAAVAAATEASIEAIQMFEDIQAALKAFEEDENNSRVLEEWKGIASMYNIARQTAEDKVREEAEARMEGFSRAPFKIDLVTKCFHLDHDAFMKDHASMLTRNPELVKAISPLALQAKFPEIFEDNPEIVKEVDAKALAILTADGRIDSAVNDLLTQEKITKVFGPKALQVSVISTASGRGK